MDVFVEDEVKEKVKVVSPKTEESSGKDTGEKDNDDYEPTENGPKSEGENKGESKGKDGKGEGENKDGNFEMEDFTFEDMEIGDKIKGPVKYNEDRTVNSEFLIKNKDFRNKKVTVMDLINTEQKSLRRNRFLEGCKLIKKELSEEKKKELELKQKAKEEKKKAEKKFLEKGITDSTAKHIISLAEVGIRNIWMVGPAGCGKSTIAEIVANYFDYPIYTMSCGIGTSAAEFIGYKYPEREGTKFAKYYKKKSVILLDEFTALDPAVAQIANGALANGALEITTKDPDTGDSRVLRHEDCIIIATSNTHGSGASSSYVANNQLDASTRDRFVGGVVNVDYSAVYEEAYDTEVLEFVREIRKTIDKNKLKRVASTRMVIQGSKIKSVFPKTWKHQLLADWSNKDLKLIDDSDITKEKEGSDVFPKEELKARMSTLN
jgi:MoxR-like ATPase